MRRLDKQLELTLFISCTVAARMVYAVLIQDTVSALKSEQSRIAEMINQKDVVVWKEVVHYTGKEIKAGSSSSCAR